MRIVANSFTSFTVKFTNSSAIALISAIFLNVFVLFVIRIYLRNSADQPIFIRGVHPGS
ncbi:hypothetical protein EVA_03090 [gut metagenome]|uniref:Uncharacterized protein n=1 Tax=gut metagenome TaxID=749906 RepID=J9GML4_9ZZZZ